MGQCLRTQTAEMERADRAGISRRVKSGERRDINMPALRSFVRSLARSLSQSQRPSARSKKSGSWRVGGRRRCPRIGQMLRDDAGAGGSWTVHLLTGRSGGRVLSSLQIFRHDIDQEAMLQCINKKEMSLCSIVRNKS